MHPLAGVPKVREWVMGTPVQAGEPELAAEPERAAQATIAGALRQAQCAHSSGTSSCSSWDTPSYRYPDRTFPGPLAL